MCEETNTSLNTEIKMTKSQNTVVLQYFCEILQTPNHWLLYKVKNYIIEEQDQDTG